MSRPIAGLLATLAILIPTTAPARPRVVSLDQCADQYVLALVPRDDIAALTPRADDEDSWLRARAAGLPLRRVSTETALSLNAQIAVRYWGGDARMMRALEQRGVRVIQIDDATDFDGVRRNVRKVAAELGQPSRGEALVVRMDAALASATHAGGGREALYVTAGGFTAGKGTLIDAMIGAAGYRNATTANGFAPVRLERLVLAPPVTVIRAFFEMVRNDRRGPGRSPVLARLSRGKSVDLPGAVASCPAWFAGDGVRIIATGMTR